MKKPLISADWLVVMTFAGILVLCLFLLLSEKLPNEVITVIAMVITALVKDIQMAFEHIFSRPQPPSIGSPNQ